MIIFILFIIIIPLLLGGLWVNIKFSSCSESIVFRYLSGFFMIFALFQVISVPMCFMKTSFSLLCSVFSVCLIILSVISIFLYYKNKKVRQIEFFKQVKEIKFCELIDKLKIICANKWAVIYFILFFIFLGFQVVMACRIDIGWRQDDDSTYITFATMALHANSMYLVNEATGIAMELSYQRSLQGAVLLIGYIAKICNVSPMIVAHTFLAIALLIIAYTTYYFLAKTILDDYEKIWIFLILLSLLYIFGHYSEYSMTFRLLGPIWQGKAILQIILTPFLFAILPKIFKEKFNLKSGWYLLMLSTAAMSMTMGGAILMVALLLVLVPLHYNRTRDKQIFIYVPFGLLVPGITAVTYLILRV